MATPLKALVFDESTGQYVLKIEFSAGVNSARSPLLVDLQEATEGENFQLVDDTRSFASRTPFDLTATATNGEVINGIIEFIKNDGTITTLIQAGGTVYSFDGVSAFTVVGTVNSGSQLRGTRFSTIATDDLVIITDLALLTPVKTWNGTTFADLTHNLTGDFFAKYCIIEHERALFANVISNAVATPHLLVASAADDINTLTITNRPASGLGVGDSFYIPMPDLRPINGLLSAFGITLLSTSGKATGHIYKLTGTTAKDFAIQESFDQSGAQGSEPIISTGNDVLWGRGGKIESLIGVETFGDVASDDASRFIADQVDDVATWTLKYNPRTGFLYAWPDDGDKLFVLQNELYDPYRKLVRSRVQPSASEALSPWLIYSTTFGSGDFRQTAAEVIKRKTDKLDVTMFGNASGQLFTMEGVGLKDGGSANITAFRTSAVIRPPKGLADEIEVLVLYERKFAATLNLDFIVGGAQLQTERVTIVLPAATGVTVYGGSQYYNNDEHYNHAGVGRIKPHQITPEPVAVQQGIFQVKASVTGAEFDIHEIEIRFKQAA